MRVPYYLDKIGNRTDFDGWFPRWYMPNEPLTFKNSNVTAMLNVIIIDSAEEIRIGVGNDWKPVVLGPQEMQL